MNSHFSTYGQRSALLSPSTRRADAKVRTRKKVLEAARSLFMERGFEAATIRDIAARADLSTGAVFANFTDKADLFNVVLSEDMDRQLELMQTALSADAPMDRILMDLFRSAYEFHLGQLPLLQAATGLSWSQGLGGPLGHPPVYSAAVAAIITILNRGQDRGELHAHADTSLLAEMMWEGYLSNYRRAIFDGRDLDHLTARLARQLRVLLAGAGVSASPA